MMIMKNMVLKQGDCSFVVHHLTGEDLDYQGAFPEALKTIAMDHIRQQRKVLMIGHSEKPCSLYDNPQHYPKLFPWLFPYGTGGIGNSLMQKKLSEKEHKKQLLMYYDKRFQTDQYFPFIAFNHAQIKDSTSGGYLLADKKSFDNITKRLLNIDLDVLGSLSTRLKAGEHVVPETDKEKDCYKVMLDLDHVAAKVQGSMTNKKYMRNQIWSLTASKGAPSWYITLSPADIKHPICLYYASNNETFNPDLPLGDDCVRMIAHNPVAGARFFHYMIETFIKHVLGVGANHKGLYGDISAYYGTVEQQGRLTLHLHMLLWILNSLTPQEIRDRIMNKDSEFQKKIVSYLESVHVGEFQTGTHAEVNYNVDIASVDRSYIDPTKVLPTPPVKKCDDKNCSECEKCIANDKWWSDYYTTVDDILLRSNMHTCSGQKTDEKKKQKKTDKKKKSKSKKDKEETDITYGCLSNKYGTCKARFPRNIVSETMIDPETGALLMKKHEQWMNTVTPMVSYLVRSNTDVTSLLSGTAIKAVIAYISDYITKSSLKTYMLFDAILGVFEKNSEYLGGKAEQHEMARKLIIQIVNCLTGKLEIGGPMACMYLLGHPDHYTNVQFKTFYWRSFVREVRQAWNIDTDESPDKIAMVTNKGNIIGLSNTSDYQHRPPTFVDMNLYDWICLATKQKRKQKLSEWIEKETDEDRAFINDDEEDELDVIGDSTSEDIQFVDDDGDKDEFDNSDGWLVDDNENDEGNILYKLLNNMSDASKINNSAADELNLEDGKPTVEQDEKWHSFISSHPQFATHQVTICSNDKAKIPDFIGGTLPRSDKGDREYYCCVMLTLFKPWRTGQNLKTEDQSWDDAFSEFNFTDHQKRLMLFFNIRYDCLDARDDFAAQRAYDHSTNDSNPYSQEMSDKLDELRDERQNMLDDDLCIDLGDIDESGPQGKNDLIRKRNMQEMENVVTHAGWLDTCADGILDLVDKTPVIPEIHKDGAIWRKEVLAKKKEAIDNKRKHMKSTPTEETAEDTKIFTAYDTAEVIDMSYLLKEFQADEQSIQDIIDSTVKEYQLNKEQERAFRIVANHASRRSGEQLKMYLGGMGGTGKSQVIKALKSFFEKRNEAHRMIILAPTGTAAALLGGFTYHSILGINPGMSGKQSEYDKIRENLRGVEYIFIDEVSMISCHDMYRICARLTKTYNVHEKPFGGMNMIFAGDFAQLPPAKGQAPLYSHNIHTSIQARMGVKQQEATIGKALWHQVTTVVILRQNMRQKTQSEEDAKFRTALENMRYKACTDDDIAFLKTRVAGKGPNKPKLSAKRFKNVAIITAWNAHKDVLNQLGSDQFAKDNRQILTDFYSIDTLTASMPDASKCKPTARSIKIYNAGIITPKLQEELWNLPPGATEHIPGKLSLCIGLPIMIRNNDATELCMTKGQEGFVAGWTTIHGPQNQLCLDTLFVKLSNPPSNVKFEGLPENIVPLTAMSHTVKCYLSDDTIIMINRKQINILPNFSMTDFASQGKTRPDNPVHVNNCNGHQAVYTCLSRSATAAGTIIVQAFSDIKDYWWLYWSS